MYSSLARASKADPPRRCHPDTINSISSFCTASFKIMAVLLLSLYPRPATRTLNGPLGSFGSSTFPAPPSSVISMCLTLVVRAEDGDLFFRETRMATMIKNIRRATPPMAMPMMASVCNRVGGEGKKKKEGGGGGAGRKEGEM